MSKTDEFGGIALDDADEFGGISPDHPDARAAATAPDEFGGLPIWAGPAAPPDYWTTHAQVPTMATAKAMLSGRPEVAPVGATGTEVSPLAQVASGYQTLPPSPEAPPSDFNMDRDLAAMREHWGPQWYVDESGAPVASPEALGDMARTVASKTAAIPYEIAGGAERSLGALASAAGGENPYANLTAKEIRERRAAAQSAMNDAIDDYTGASRGQKMRKLANGLFVPEGDPTDAQALALAKVFSANAELDRLKGGAAEPEGTTSQMLREAGTQRQANADQLAEWERKNNMALQPNPNPEWRTSLGNRIAGGGVDALSMAGQSALGPAGIMTLSSSAFEKSYQRAMEDVPADVQADPVKLAQFKQQAQIGAAREAVSMTMQMLTYHATNAGSAAAMRAYLPEAGAGQRVAAGTIANMFGSAANRGMSGESMVPSIEGTMADAALAALGVKQGAEMAAKAKADAAERAKGALPDTPGMRQSLDTSAQAWEKARRAEAEGVPIPPAGEADRLTDRLAYFGTSGHPIVVLPGEKIEHFEHIAKLPGNDVNPQVATLPDGRRILYDPTLTDGQGKLITPDADSAVNFLGIDTEPASVPRGTPESEPQGTPPPANVPEPAEPYVGPGSREFRQSELEQTFAPEVRGGTTPQDAAGLRAQLERQQRIAAQLETQRRVLAQREGPAAPDQRAGYENQWQQLLAQKEAERGGAQSPAAGAALARRLGMQETQTPRTGGPRAESTARTGPPTGAGPYEPEMLDQKENHRILGEIADIMGKHTGSPNDGSSRIENGVRHFLNNMSEAEKRGDLETMADEGRHLRDLRQQAEKFKKATEEEPRTPNISAGSYGSPESVARRAAEAEALSSLEGQQQGHLSPEDATRRAEAERAGKHRARLQAMTDTQFSREAGRLDRAATPEWLKKEINDEGQARLREASRKEARAAGGTTPLLDFIQSAGGIRGLSKGRKEFQGGEVEALREASPAVKRRLMQNDRGEPGALAIDEMTQHAVDEGLLREGATPQDLIDAASKETQSARKLRTIGAPDMFGHEEPGEEQVAAAKEKADNRAELERRFSKRLEAKDLDTTGDMFGGGDLLSLRGREKPVTSTNENDALRSAGSAEGEPNQERLQQPRGAGEDAGGQRRLFAAEPGRAGERGGLSAPRDASITNARNRAYAKKLDDAYNAPGGRRDQADGMVRRMASGMRGFGDLLFHYSDKNPFAGYGPDGTLAFNLPRNLHQWALDHGVAPKDVQPYIDRTTKEELIHFASLAVSHDEWQASGMHVDFKKFVANKEGKIYDSIKAAADALERRGNKQGADAIRQLLADSQNLYHGNESPFARMTMGDNHIPELLRQVIQTRMDLGPTEEAMLDGPLAMVRDWAAKIVRKLRDALGAIGGGEWGNEIRREIENTEAMIKGEYIPKAGQDEARYPEGGHFPDVGRPETDFDMHAQAAPGSKVDEEERKTFAQRNAEHDVRKAAFDQLSRDEKFDLANENIEAQNPKRGFFSTQAKDAAGYIKEAADGLTAGIKSVKDFLNPAGASEEAGATARNIREQNARADREQAMAVVRLKAAEKAVEKLDPKESLKAMDDIETGGVTADHSLRPIVDAMKEGYDQRIAIIRRLVPGAMEHLIKNYLVHLWKDPKAAEDFYSEALSMPHPEKASLEGAKGFMKKRTIPTTLDGVAWRSDKYPNGMEPLSWNFVKMTRLKYQEMDRFIMGQRIFAEERRAGRAVFVPADGHAPAGTVPIDDKIAKVYAPPWVDVPEFNDARVTAKLAEIIDQLGFGHKRAWKLSGKPSAAGIAYMEYDQMETKHNTPEGVVEHELGHLLDGKYGIWDALTKPPGQETVTLGRGPRAGETVTRTRRTPADETAARVAISKELRALADLRMEGIENQVSGHFKKYIRNREEKIANAVNALIYAPDRMQEVAPNVYRNLREFLAARPELKPILDIRNSLVLGGDSNRMPLKGHRLLGQYYAPAESARVLNNFLTPGWQGAPAYDAIRASANLLNAAQLGWSGFHAGFVALDTTLSKFSLALMQASQGGQDVFAGRFGKGLRNLGSAAVNAAKFGAGVSTLGATSLGEAYYKGHRMIKEYEKPGSVGGIVSEMVDKALAGGWAPYMDNQYRIGAMKGFTEAVKDGRYLKAAIKSPLAAVELGMYPIMEVLVPRMKAAVIYDMMKWEARELPKDATPDQIRQVAARVSDHVDNRLGQMRYDNLFLNKKFKDSLMLAQRSLGWNLGTLRELGGGIASAATMPERMKRGERMLTHDTAYLVAILTGVPMMGALYQFLHTGQLPQDERDLFAPRTGRTMPDGSAERVMLPSYAKDLHSYGVHPGQTVVNKLNPLWNSLISALWTNKDFYGTQVRDPSADALTQAGQLAKFGAKQFLPFSYTAAGRRVSAPGSGIESFFGIQPAPADIRRSKAQNLISEYFQSKGTAGAVTPEAKADKDTARAVSDILRNNAYQLPPDVRARLDSLPVAAQIKALKEGTSTPMQLAFKLLPLDVAEQVYQAATPRERDQLEALLDKKRENAEKKKANQAKQLDKLKAGAGME